MIKLIDILKENKRNIYLTMYALFTEKNGSWKTENDWSFNPTFKTQGLIATYGKGANGQSWGKPSILCTEYNGENPFEGSHSGWKYAIIFKKNIDEIYIDDEIFYYGDYPSEEQEKEAIEYIYKTTDNKQDVSLGVLHTKFGSIIIQDNFPQGNYVLNIKPNEIIKIVKGEGNIKIKFGKSN